MYYLKSNVTFVTDAPVDNNGLRSRASFAGPYGATGLASV